MELCHEIHCHAHMGNESAKGHGFGVSRNCKASKKIRREGQNLSKDFPQPMMNVDVFWHCGVVCLDHLGRPRARIDPVASRFEASVNQAKQLTLAGWCHSWSRVINLLREGTSKESRDLWQSVGSKQKTFFPCKSLTHFVLVEGARRKHLEMWKFHLSLPFPVSYFFSWVHFVLQFQYLSPGSWKQDSVQSRTLLV